MDDNVKIVGFIAPTAICRHPAGSLDCSKSGHRSYQYTPPEPKTPDAEKYSIETAVQVGTNLVLKVKYPNCSSCAYEGSKVMVFLNVQALAALKWKRIDPHFRAPKLKCLDTEAPSPDARFPASAEGWNDALDYAKRTR